MEERLKNIENRLERVENHLMNLTIQSQMTNNTLTGIFNIMNLNLKTIAVHKKVLSNLADSYEAASEELNNIKIV